MTIQDEHIKLAQDLYTNGYQCGITDALWFKAYAIAMQQISEGASYTDFMVVDIYRGLNGRRSSLPK